MKNACLLLVFAALPMALAAQTVPAGRSRPGDLVGARPTTARPAARPAGPGARATVGNPETDPVQQHLLQTTIDLPTARAEQLPDLYERLMATTRAERRQWSAADWAAAGQVLAGLDQRYQQVRTELPLEERLRVRAFQGEFRTLRGTRGL